MYWTYYREYPQDGFTSTTGSPVYKDSLEVPLPGVAPEDIRVTVDDEYRQIRVLVKGTLVWSRFVAAGADLQGIRVDSVRNGMLKLYIPAKAVRELTIPS